MKTLIAEELYKIVSRKIVKIGFAAVIFCILAIFAVIGPPGERSVLGEDGGAVKTGFAAIAQDQELAERYEGILTDEIVERMAEECYFLKIVDGAAVNANYVNKALANYGLTNAASRGENATATIPIADSEMGRLTDKPIHFGYIQGWRVLYTLMSVGFILLCILIMVAVVPVFSEEYALKTAPVLLTTEYGKSRDVAAKIIASVLFSLSVLLVCAVFMFLLCGFCYGFGGLECFAGMLDGNWYLANDWIGSVSYLSIGQFFLIFFGFVLVGTLILCAFCLWASASFKQTYLSLLLSALFYVLPAAVWFYILLSGATGTFVFYLGRIMYCMPMYACMNGTVAELTSSKLLCLRGVTAFAVIVPCVFGAVRRYRGYRGNS